MYNKKFILFLIISFLILSFCLLIRCNQSENQTIPQHDYIIEVITTKSTYSDNYSAHMSKEVFYALNQSRYRNTVENSWGYLYPLSTTWQNLLIYDCTMDYTISFYNMNNKIIAEVSNQIHFIIHQSPNDDSWYIVQYHEEA
ncbi:MAG TPA: hypothetical protein H9979_03665 [Candidatus Megamonas gallistercoris]|nr:hypothetical protein [Candidatus Megamonas gallistercoris]